MGNVPRVADLATDLSTTQENVRSGPAELAAVRHLALGAKGEIAMAHPFTPSRWGWCQPPGCGTTSSTPAATLWPLASEAPN